MYVFVCVRKYANIYIYLFIYIHNFECIHICVCMYLLVYIHICIYVDIYIYIYSDGPKLRISRLFPKIFDPELRIWSQWRVRMYS